MVARAVKAVENGQVSVEQLLRAALRQGSSFAGWLEGKVSRWPDRQVRRPHIRTPRRLPPDVPRLALRQGRKKFGNIVGVTSIHWGLMRRRGIYIGHSGVVLFVERKLPAGSLAARERLPPNLNITFKGRRFLIPIDVQAPGVARRHSIEQARPGKQSTVRAAEQGVLSAVVQVDGGLRALLSGHVAGSPGNAVTLVAPDGATARNSVVDRVANSSFNDLAATQPLAVADVPLFSFLPVQVRDPGLNETGGSVTIVTLRGAVQTSITDIGVSHDFLDGRPPMEGLFATPAQTIDGDSGSPAFDAAGKLVGIVVGGPADKTFLIPARRAINDLF